LDLCGFGLKQRIDRYRVASGQFATFVRFDEDPSLVDPYRFERFTRLRGDLTAPVGMSHVDPILGDR
jgi:hypothetical protein